MSTACFSTYSVMLAVLAPLLLYMLYWQAKLGRTVVMREDFAPLPNGDLDGGQAYFNAQTRTLEWHEKSGLRPIPFADISKIMLEVRTSRKIHLWLGIGEELLHIGVVSNHDLKRAGVNGHLVAEVVAGQGDNFLVAFRQHQWKKELIGATFEYVIIESS